MTERCWVARVQGAPRDAWACAQLGDGAGWLAAWRQADRPCDGALLADPRALDPAGTPAHVSLAWAPDGFDLLYDDAAVQRARQVVLEGEPAAAMTTLSRDASHIGGALTARRDPDAARRLRDDPFARLLPTVLVAIGPGLIGAAKPPASLVIERYGPTPWPADRFPGDEP
jgi:hypothetical protein